MSSRLMYWGGEGEGREGRGLVGVARLQGRRGIDARLCRQMLEPDHTSPPPPYAAAAAFPSDAERTCWLGLGS